MRNHLKLLIGAAVLFWLASCNVTKDLHKSTTTTDTAVEIKTDITQTVTETIDTTLAIASQTLTGIKAITEMQAGDSIFEETPDLEIVTKVDHGIVKTIAIKRIQVIPITAHKITVTHMAQDAKSEVKQKIDTKDLHKVITSGFPWGWLALIIILVLLAEAWHLGWFKRKKSDETA